MSIELITIAMIGSLLLLLVITSAAWQFACTVSMR